MLLTQLTNQHKGGGKASREFPNCPSKNNEKKGNSEKRELNRKPFSWGKHLSLGTAYVLQGISERLKSRLIIGTTGDISTACGGLESLLARSSRISSISHKTWTESITECGRII